MRILDPALEAVLTSLGATTDEKAMLINYVMDQASSVRGQVNGLRANAEMAFNQANALEPLAEALETMLEKFTDEVPDPIPPEQPE